MSIKIFSSSVSGIEAQLIEVEVDSAPGLHNFNIVGLPGKAVEESKERIASAIRNNKLLPPSAKHKKIIVNLAPADIKKEGPAYDLPIAIGYLLETEQLKFKTADKLFVGELSLDGSIKPVNGVLSTVSMAKKFGFKEVFVPSLNSKEALIIKGISIIPCDNINQVINHLNGINTINPGKSYNLEDLEDVDPEFNQGDSFLSIKGQEAAKRALVVSAAGSHNILMSGPPGSGKTLLAKVLTELLPRLSNEEAIEVTKIYSSAGKIAESGLSLKRPFRSPHHTTSAPAVIGGGTIPKPGEISLAHRGVLFLDEVPEFPRNVLESLRQPLEEGVITVSRASKTLTLPAKFTLVAAMNPCPCGNFGEERATCSCPPQSILKYKKKISGPLLDRIDIQILVPRESIGEKKISAADSEEFKKIKLSIEKAKEIQNDRFKNLNIFSNSEVDYKNIDKFCRASKEAEDLIQKAVNLKGLSFRSYHKIKKLSRTIADLDQSENIKENHAAEALSLRVNEKIFSELI